MYIHEVAKLTGLSVRTLHYYHQIKLVVPDKVNDAGYRIYTEQQLQLIEHINFFKQLGFSLKEISVMVNNEHFKSIDAYKLQHRSLLDKQKHLANQIVRLEQLIHAAERGEKTKMMTNLNFNTKQYEQEAREKWGDKAVDDSLFKLNHLSKEEQQQLKQKWDDIYSALAKQIDEPVNHPQTEAIIGDYYRLLNSYFGKYDYNAFIGLGQLYVYDARFTANIDQYREGLAHYMCEAMSSWGKKQQK